MRPVVLILGCLLASSCGSVEATPTALEARTGDQPTTSDAAAAKPEPVVWRDEERGFRVSHPDSWRRAASPLTPYLSDPVELFALGTYALRAGGDRCAHQPVNAVEDLGPEDALIVIFERAQPFTTEGYPPRPDDPRLARGTNRFCVPGRNRFDSWLPFGESGRAFYALIAIGENASDQTLAEVSAIYDSIAFDER